MTKEGSVTFVLLSDLHLGSRPLDEGDASIADTGIAAEMSTPFDAHFRSIVRTLCVPHDFTLLDQLPNCIRHLAYDEGVAAYIAGRGSRHYDRYKFDQFVLLGDLVTFPTTSAFQLAEEFIGGKRALRVPLGKDLDEVHGLRLLKSEYLMIPGNHDKLLRYNLDQYYRELCSPLRYPLQPSTCGSYFQSRVFQEQEFLFISIDANIYLNEEQNPMLDKSHFAQGRVTAALHEELRKKFVSLRQGQRVDDAEVVNWSETFKILLVHYAVDEKKVLGRFPNLKYHLPPLSCELLREFIDCSGDDIDLVLHGHLHRAKLYSQNRIPVISVPSCLQMGGNQGFYLLRLFRHKKLRLQHYCWKRTGFRADKNPTLSGVWENHKWSPIQPNL